MQVSQTKQRQARSNGETYKIRNIRVPGSIDERIQNLADETGLSWSAMLTVLLKNHPDLQPQEDHGPTH